MGWTINGSLHVSFELKLVWEAKQLLPEMRSGAVHGAICSDPATEGGGVDAAATYCGGSIDRHINGSSDASSFPSSLWFCQVL